MNTAMAAETENLFFIGAPQVKPTVDFKILNQFLGWGVTLCSQNIIRSRFTQLFFYPGKIGFVP
jgi:hypothetical protein